MSSEDVQTQQLAQQLQEETRGIQPLPVQPPQDAASNPDFIPCMWLNCGERMPGAEALYEHVCERHIGRKSTNNLNLTCQWGNCRTTTVKRDHITSHMRVHVPLKPHKCEFCGKAFKRPQDLKKHVKTHADDSVLLRSPDSRNQQNGQGALVGLMSSKLTYIAAYFPGHDMSTGAYPPANGHNGANNNFYPNPQSYNGYGQVNYPGTSLADQQSMETRRRAIEALNDFLGDVKRRALDPQNYYDVGHRLNTQALPLPVSIGAGYSMGNGYQGQHGGGNNNGNNYSATSLLETFGASASNLLNQTGNVATHGAMTQNYQLPMSNARTKADLLDIDRFLEQLSNTVYESSGQAAAAGVQQPGVHTQLASGYGSFNSGYRSSHSPPQGQVSNAGSGGAMPALSSVAQMANMTANGQAGADTPALTPASVSSYTSSGHSPVSSHSRASGDGSSMYPQLPSVTGMSDMGPGYNSAPPSGLASGFESYDSRRYSGGRLQREAPAPSATSDSMDVDSDGQRTPRKMSLIKEALRAASPSNVDPALRSEQSTENGPTSDSPASDNTEDKAQDAWVENVRVIEQLRTWVRQRLEQGDFERDENSTPEPASEIKDEQPPVEEPIAYPTLKTEEE
ncbi:hypothetical protein K461DRAFT_220484 [Myriangium duriaei CBS 260.36]|uniref:pH-response transcription factor pacC/RIM101 n=1 Tax=Myriangium duriaei CBS 260.36 TaxID=1168546 RepID=A0A9P4ML43_9PEZI|nr:hypothetical protein K461DRAFT_220484 [Myriangium duriaei CBS 260.36]